jgi:hypothetical protein
MLDRTIMQPEAILVLEVKSKPEKKHFVHLGASVDAYLSDYAASAWVRLS